MIIIHSHADFCFPSSSLPCFLPQYQRNYFVSWDSVFVPADVLLASQGAGPSPGVDHAWQIQAFLDTWTKGECLNVFSMCGAVSLMWCLVCVVLVCVFVCGCNLLLVCS